MSELKANNSSLHSRLEEASSEKERLSCQVADVSGNAATNAAAMAKRNEALQKMVSTALSHVENTIERTR